MCLSYAVVNRVSARFFYVDKPPEILFNPEYLGIFIAGCFVEDIIQPDRNFLFRHIIWYHHLVQRRILSFIQVDAKYQPLLLVSFYSNNPTKHVVNQHGYSFWI
ncbi:hypothetical protein Dda3937_03224 [Dickeya dadantii 3937]|uniref:Uncharacterized protein n=1 Tax=Dickeya dadantii (strain 3937) TaxID=198628 RepID=E0SME0_DICD3|nr:hypothetical protein Dda3937_03224 [Dickeya dadantii 3937]